MTSLSAREAARFGVRRRHSTAKRVGAVVYGLLLAGAVLFILQPELVEKFHAPLLYSISARVEYSADNGVTWRVAAPSAGAAQTFVVTRPGTAGGDVLLRARDPKAPLEGIEEAAVKIEYSTDVGETWKRAPDAETGKTLAKLTLLGESAPVAPNAVSAASVLLRVVNPRTGQASNVGAGFVDRVLLAWLVALAPIVPVGLLVAWLVLSLGYLKNAATACTLVFFTLFGLTMIVPFLWMISTAFKTQEATDVYKIQWIAWPVRWLNFHDVFSRVNFARFYMNSVFLSCYVTLGLVFTSSLAAYSFARLEFPGRDKIFMAYLATMMIPGAVTSMPVFVLMCKIGWVDSYKAIIIPGIFSAYGTFMLRQFFMTLPRELEDAAKIDGCSLFGIFTRIIVPLSKPALATLTIFTFMGEWNDFMWPLIILNDPNKMPLPVGLQFFNSSEMPDPNVLMCASMLMILPIIIVFLLGQRYFVEGIQLGAVKG